MDRYSLAKRNYRAMVCEGAFFFAGYAFLDPASVIPVFIDTYTRNLRLAGLAATLYSSVVVLTQVLFAPRVPKIRHAPAFLARVMLTLRPAALYAVPFLLLAPSPGLKVGAFLISFAVFSVGQGLIGLVWLDLFGRTIPMEDRGRLQGNQQLFAGLGGIFSGFAVKLVLQSAALPHDLRFALVFGAGGLVMLGSAYCMSLARDIPRPPASEAVRRREYYRRLPCYLIANRWYRAIVCLQLANALVTMVYPFVILFAKRSLSLAPAQVSLLVYLQLLGKLAGGLLWGTISHRHGNKYVIRGVEASSFLLLALAAGSSLAPPGAAFFLAAAAVVLTGINMTGWLGFTNYTIDVVDDESRPHCLLLANILAFPFSFLPFFAGNLAQRLGFLPLFTLSAAAALTIFAFSFTLHSQADLRRLHSARVAAKARGMCG